VAVFRDVDYFSAALYRISTRLHDGSTFDGDGDQIRRLQKKPEASTCSP
jgi:hypothetical protein